MLYTSTRNPAGNATFEDVVVNGLAPDGGLYVPETIPNIDPETRDCWRGLSYNDLAVEIISLYSGDAIPQDDVRRIVNEASAEFRQPEWLDIQRLEETLVVAELYHGPTYSFKDYALTIVGRLMSYFLARRQQHGVVLVATSGDTGSSAIAGFRGKAGTECVVLVPKGRTADIQRMQMTTVPDKNIHVGLVNGDFDDCQRLLKEAFNNDDLRKERRLLAVNSVNFGRIVCQMIYYWFLALKFFTADNPVNFVVPTGNFGNILAGWYAKHMGCPIGRLVIASNVNDILTRYHGSGVYKLGTVTPTISPSIDIQISSNFERVLWHNRGKSVGDWFDDLKHKGCFTTDEQTFGRFCEDFSAASSTDEETLEQCALIFEAYGYVIDPHTGVALCAAAKLAKHLAKSGSPTIVLSTAHPAKFAEALTKVIDANVLTDLTPDVFIKMRRSPERYKEIQPNWNDLQEFLRSI